MKNPSIFILFILITGCTTSVTYFKPYGNGERYGHCNTPLHGLQTEITKGVVFSINASKTNDDKDVYLYASYEIKTDNTVQLTSPYLTIISDTLIKPFKYKITDFIVRHPIMDRDGNVLKIKEIKKNSTDILKGKTYSDKGFWGSIRGEYGRKFSSPTIINNFSGSEFVLHLPEILLNGEPYMMEDIKFILTTETIYLSACP